MFKSYFFLIELNCSQWFKSSCTDGTNRIPYLRKGGNRTYFQNTVVSVRWIKSKIIALSNVSHHFQNALILIYVLSCFVDLLYLFLVLLLCHVCFVYNSSQFDRILTSFDLAYWFFLPKIYFYSQSQFPLSRYHSFFVSRYAFTRRLTLSTHFHHLFQAVVKHIIV